MRFIDGVGYVDIPDEKNDWYDVPSDEMTLEQARQAVKGLRKKLVEHLDQDSKPGYWQKHTDDSGNSWYTCPKCGCVAYTLTRFCPDCGMRLEVYNGV